MEFLRQFAGIVCILFICKILYELAVIIGSKANFYESFSKILTKFKGRKKI